MRLIAILVAFAALLAAPTDARAQDISAECEEAGFTPDDWYGRFCRPDYPAKFRRMVSALPLSSIARHHRARRAVRVIAIDGHLYQGDYPYHLIAIDVIEQGDGAVAIVRGQGDRWNNPVVRTRLAETDWAYVAENADRLTGRPAVVPWQDLCFHPMEIILETHGFGEPRTLFRDFCSQDNFVYAYGYSILKRVLAASRRCRRTDEEEWVLNRLRSCVERALR
jgi:hypothetical protein